MISPLPWFNRVFHYPRELPMTSHPEAEVHKRVVVSLVNVEMLALHETMMIKISLFHFRFKVPCVKQLTWYPKYRVMMVEAPLGMQLYVAPS